MIRLDQLPVQRKARIVKVEDQFLHFQMIAKGLTLGSIVEVSRKTLFNSCLYLRCEAHSLAIQKAVAEIVYVEEI